MNAPWMQFDCTVCTNGWLDLDEKIPCVWCVEADRANLTHQIDQLLNGVDFYKAKHQSTLKTCVELIKGNSCEKHQKQVFLFTLQELIDHEQQLGCPECAKLSHSGEIW